MNNYKHQIIVISNDSDLTADEAGLLAIMLSQRQCKTKIAHLSLNQISKDYKISRKFIRDNYNSLLKKLSKDERVKVFDRSTEYEYAFYYECKDYDKGNMTIIYNNETEMFKYYRMTVTEIGIYIKLRMLGYSPYTTIKDISEEAGISERQTRRIIHKLSVWGLIHITKKHIHSYKYKYNYIFPYAHQNNKKSADIEERTDTNIAYLLNSNVGTKCHYTWYEMSRMLERNVIQDGTKCPLTWYEMSANNNYYNYYNYI